MIEVCLYEPENPGNVGNIIRRMPSSSRAYPLALEKKAAFYRTMLECELDI